jgi:hypothetical protein
LYCLKNDQYQTIDLLLKNNVNVNQKNYEGKNFLFELVFKSPDIVEKYLSKYDDIEINEVYFKEEFTILYYLFNNYSTYSMKNFKKLFMVLIKYGAKYKIEDVNNFSIRMALNKKPYLNNYDFFVGVSNLVMKNFIVSHKINFFSQFHFLNFDIYFVFLSKKINFQNKFNFF